MVDTFAGDITLLKQEISDKGRRRDQYQKERSMFKKKIKTSHTLTTN